ncbi:MAG TPA: hypothetical protein VKY39_10585 [Aggregatilineales bacterium]|nr:hypothetical protein [Aggregatilineales bacterium]
MKKTAILVLAALVLAGLLAACRAQTPDVTAEAPATGTPGTAEQPGGEATEEPADTAIPATIVTATSQPATTAPTTAPATTAPTATPGQSGGAADAERLQFDPGATDEVVTGELAARETDSYVLRVLEGQFMEVAITPEAAAQLVVYGADGTVLRSGMGEGSMFRGVVPSTQDYFVEVSAGSSPVDYTMSVIIPERITFGAGDTAAIMEGELSARESHHYVVNAMAEQLMEVSVDPAESVQLIVYGVDGTVLRSGMGEGSFWRGELPSTQDYIVKVSAGAQAVSDYSLSVLIPARITFDAGEISAEVSGELGETDEVFYVIRAMAGQTMQVDVTPDDALQTAIYGVDGSVMKSGMGGGPDYTGELTISQDYIIMLRTGPKASDYEMVITIE